MKKLISFLVMVIMVSSFVPVMARAQTTSVSVCSIDLATATHDQLLNCLISLESQLIVLLTQLQMSQPSSTVAQPPAIAATSTPSSPTPSNTQTATPIVPVTAMPQTQPVLPPQAPPTVSAPQQIVVTVTPNPSFTANVSKFDAGNVVASFILTNPSTQNTYVSELQIRADVPFLQNVRPVVNGAQSGVTWGYPAANTRQVLGGDIYVAAGNSVQLNFVSDFSGAAVATGTFPSALSLCGASAINGTVRDANNVVLNPYGTCTSVVPGEPITIQ